MEKASQFEFSSYFQLFNLPEEFQIDLKQLKNQYRSLQRQYHPDRFAHKSAHEQRISLQFAAYINEAFITLKSPVKRAHYLLELRHLVQAVSQTTSNDSDFLMMQIELREELDGIRDIHCDIEKQSSLAQLTNRLDTLNQIQIVAFSKAISVDNPNSKELVDIYYKLQFFDKLITVANELV